MRYPFFLAILCATLITTSCEESGKIDMSNTFRGFNNRTKVGELYEKAGRPKSVTGSGISQLHYPLGKNEEVVVGTTGENTDATILYINLYQNGQFRESILKKNE